MKKRLLELKEVALLSVLNLFFLVDSLLNFSLLFSLFCFNFCKVYIHFKFKLIIIIKVMTNKDFITPEGVNYLIKEFFNKNKFKVI
jgi:hypothetical protein